MSQLPIPEHNYLTLREFILLARDFIKEIIFKFYIVLILMAGCAYYQYQKYKDIVRKDYTAKLSFMLNDQSGNTGVSSQALNLLSKEFGLGSTGAATAPSEKKLIELLRTRKILSTTLFKVATIDGKPDFFINHYQTLFKSKNDTTDTLSYIFTDPDFNNFERSQNKVLNSVANACSQMINAIPSTSGIITISMNATNEEFCKEFLIAHMNSLSDFYIGRTTEKVSSSYEKLKYKMDSLRMILTSKESQLASEKDKNMLSIKAETRVDELRMQREISILNSMYAETAKAAEIARYNLSSQAPLLQIIDSPTYPLKINYYSYKKYVITGLIVGFITAIVLICMYKIVRDALKQKPNETY